ncbi:hypothetical protein MWN33_10175 [Starkeya koreensis]|uniref:Uncharacterized protein n=1 Tax=Ancylobacter koreensis TaxID=266121 RepID=A0ABT0DM80_9HYPH|nr:hypothetical protein [Ancylobacter koreensis]MCK0208395.1 hypothetical protein [Ancylobacter koreensis]
MTTNSEDRARAVCAVDAKLASVPTQLIPALVERLWPVAALEINGGLVDPDLPRPPDLVERISEYRLLKR